MSEAEPRRIKLGGREWEIPAELPVDFHVGIATNDVTAAAEVLVGADDADAFALLLTRPVVDALCALSPPPDPLVVTGWRYWRLATGYRGAGAVEQLELQLRLDLAAGRTPPGPLDLLPPLAGTTVGRWSTGATLPGGFFFRTIDHLAQHLGRIAHPCANGPHQSIRQGRFAYGRTVTSAISRVEATGPRPDPDVRITPGKQWF